MKCLNLCQWALTEFHKRFQKNDIVTKQGSPYALKNWFIQNSTNNYALRASSFSYSHSTRGELSIDMLDFIFCYFLTHYMNSKKNRISTTLKFTSATEVEEEKRPP